ncbi:MAG: hypothetical protein IKI38_03705 [Mogibacterium sp.]|nr:hypothetical protein [Mogibacterium sp.]
MNSKTLKEIYEYDLIPDDAENYPQEEWFNVLMKKTPEDLTLSDICRMLRQKICSVVAIDRAIEMLESDLFEGELYEGQLMTSLFNAKEKYLRLRYDDIAPILSKAELSALSHEWQSADEKSEYLRTVEAFISRIKEAQ